MNDSASPTPTRAAKAPDVNVRAERTKPYPPISPPTRGGERGGSPEGSILSLPKEASLSQHGGLAPCRAVEPVLDRPWLWVILVLLLPAAGYLISGYLPRLVLYTLYTLVLLAVSYYDLREQRVPNRLSYPSILFALGAMFHSPGWKSALIGGAVAGAVLFIPVLIYGAERAGIGDVKLALLIGLILGWSVPLFWAALLAFVLAAIVSLIGILLKRLTFKSKLPFGPFMALGAIVAMFTMA